MARRFELIVFDWDGTLMDSAGTIVTSLQAAAVDLGFAAPTDERARHTIGLGLSDAVRYALPDLPEVQYDDFIDRYRHHYLSRDHDLMLFEGAESLVRALRESNYLLGVATGKSRLGLNRALAVSGLGEWFHATRCADECRSKPHPQMLEELMEEFGLAPERLLMIGDTTHDLQMAQNAGVSAVAVTHGAHPRALLETESPLFLADDMGELMTWIRE